MSETTATRIPKGATLAAGAVVWCVGAWYLSRTSVPSLHLPGLDQNRFFAKRALDRAASYGRGEDAIFVTSTLAELGALLALARRLPRHVKGMGIGRIGSAVVAGMVLLVTLWFVDLPFSLADLWWQHHWGLGPFDPFTWFAAQWAVLPAEVIFFMATIVLLVGLAGPFRRWYLIAGPIVVVLAALFAFTGGWLAAAGTQPIRDAQLRSDVTRLERTEQVEGTPVSVRDVSKWTDQANAFTAGIGPSTHVVVWNTLLDGRFTRAENDVVIAHELAHARSGHIAKSIGWTALIVIPTLWLLAVATRRRGGVGDPANLPYVILVLTVITLVTSPLQNAVSRRYEAEADWRALNATRDPAAAQTLFRRFSKTSLERPNPGAFDYLWLQNHPTLMQRIAMAAAWKNRNP